MTTDPSAIRALAIHAEDLLAAAEADARGGPRTVLRVTPPFSGRMRARLHVVQDEGDDGAGAGEDDENASTDDGDADADEERTDGQESAAGDGSADESADESGGEA